MKPIPRITHRRDPEAERDAEHPFRPLARGRPAYVMAEAILGFAILGVVLAGLFPFVLTQLRMTRKLESRFAGNVTFREQSFMTGGAYYCIPWKNPRMRALFGGASITTDAQNSVDDFTPTHIGGNKRAPVTIYGFQITYPGSTGDPEVSVDVNVEVSP